jgi:hypothetical protein
MLARQSPERKKEEERVYNTASCCNREQCQRWRGAQTFRSRTVSAICGEIYKSPSETKLPSSPTPPVHKFRWKYHSCLSMQDQVGDVCNYRYRSKWHQDRGQNFKFLMLKRLAAGSFSRGILS